MGSCLELLGVSQLHKKWVVSMNGGWTPQNGWFITGNPMKIGDLEVPSGNLLHSCIAIENVHLCLPKNACVGGYWRAGCFTFRLFSLLRTHLRVNLHYSSVWFPSRLACFSSSRSTAVLFSDIGHFTGLIQFSSFSADRGGPKWHFKESGRPK